MESREAAAEVGMAEAGVGMAVEAGVRWAAVPSAVVVTKAAAAAVPPEVLLVDPTMPHSYQKTPPSCRIASTCR